MNQMLRACHTFRKRQVRHENQLDRFERHSRIVSAAARRENEKRRRLSPPEESCGRKLKTVLNYFGLMASALLQRCRLGLRFGLQLVQGLLQRQDRLIHQMAGRKFLGDGHRRMARGQQEVDARQAGNASLP